MEGLAGLGDGCGGVSCRFLDAIMGLMGCVL